MKTITVDGVELIANKKFGCYWGAKGNVLFYCPMNSDGTADKDCFGEVELLSQSMLKEAKQKFQFNEAPIIIEED